MKKNKSRFELADYVDTRVLKIYIIILLTILLIAVFVVIGVKIYRYRLKREEAAKPALYTEQDISSILKSPGLTDFIIPESLESGERGFSLYREQLKSWTNEMVDNYIIPPEDLGVDQISRESKRIIEEKLDDIP